jgi:hypothetical protein
MVRLLLLASVLQSPWNTHHRLPDTCRTGLLACRHIESSGCLRTGPWSLPQTQAHSSPLRPRDTRRVHRRTGSDAVRNLVQLPSDDSTAPAYRCGAFHPSSLRFPIRGERASDEVNWSPRLGRFADRDCWTGRRTRGTTSNLGVLSAITHPTDGRACWLTSVDQWDTARTCRQAVPSAQSRRQERSPRTSVSIHRADQPAGLPTRRIRPGM